MGWNEGWVQLGTGCGGAGRLPDAVLSMMTAGLFGVGPSRVSQSGGNRFTPGLKGGFLPPEVSARLPGLFWTPRAPCSDLSLVLFQKIPPLRELTDGV